jgi:hypothetical protein
MQLKKEAREGVRLRRLALECEIHAWSAYCTVNPH